MSQENVEVVRQLAVAVGERDLATLLGLTDPDVEWHTTVSAISEGGAYHGHDGVRQYVDDLREAFETFEVRLDSALDVGDLVIAVGAVRYCGKASGVELDASVGWVVRFRAGRVILARAFRDPEQTLEAVGLRE